nr:MAG TPA: hypothetical protein [Caudoviricetes sp.]
MTNAEAVVIVHRMMEARDREQENIAAEKQKAANAFWKTVFHEFVVYGTAALGVLAFTLLMAVAQ